MFIFKVRQHQVRQIVQNVGIISQLHRQNRMGNISNGVFQKDNTHIVDRKTELAQRVVLGDAVILAVSRQLQEFPRSRPIVSDTVYINIQSVRPTGHGDSVDRPWRGVVTTDGWKYVVMENQPWLLFNLNEDPYELANLAFNTRYRTERQRLHDRLADWINDTEDKFAIPSL